MTEEKMEMTLDELVAVKATSLKPVKVVHSGSTTRAMNAFNHWRLQDTLNGLIVLTIGAAKNDTELGLSKEQMIALDVLHLHKIDEADFMRVFNVDGYIGASTTREIEYAKRLGKRIVYLEYHEDMRYTFCTSCLVKNTPVCQFCGFCFTCEPNRHIPCEFGHFMDDMFFD